MVRTSRSPRRTALVVALAAAVLCGWPSAASADPAEETVTGLTVVSHDTGGFNSPGSKTITANCPPGQKVFGPGGTVDLGYGEVVLDEFVPSADLTSVTVQALEHGNSSLNWDVTAYAVCADPVDYMLRVFDDSPQNTSSPKNVTVSCPPGLKVYGIGAEIINGQGNVTLDDLDIDESLTFVDVGAYGWHGTTVANAWAVRAYAVCGTPASTMRRVKAQEPSTWLDTALYSPSCPAGTSLTGVGGELSGAQGDAVFDDLKPDLDQNRAFVQAQDIGAGGWTTAAYGVCAS
jgi:hypothetical protein